MMGAGAHLESCNDITKTGLDPKHIEIIKKIKASHKELNFGPAKERHTMLDHGYTESELPPVKQVQNFLNYQRNTNSTHHDVSSFEKQLETHTVRDARENHTAFVFGSSVLEDGSVKIGSGHENSHFNVSFTSRSLLANVKKAQEMNDSGKWKMTLAIDFTFKTNLLGYYFGVMGVIDAMRHFFVGGLSLLSHKTTEDYTTTISDFKEVCRTQGGFTLDPFYCMLDGEAAIRNALEHFFGNVSKILMCFFHVMKNCKEHLKGVPVELKNRILRKIRGLHMSTSAFEFQLRLADFLTFLATNNLQNFADYFVATWVHSTHCFWRLFDTVPGVGNTNNAVEAFNKHFKAEFLYNKKYPLDELLPIICWIIRFYSTKDMQFQTTLSPESKHKKRALALTAVNAIINRCYYPNPYTVVRNDDGTFTWTKGFPLPNNLHRSYTVQIQKDGEDFCRCPVFMKLAYCKHTIATIQKFGLISMRLGRGKFKNHKTQKRGRRAKNTPALEVDDTTPLQTAITMANVPVLNVDSSNKSACPEGWIEGSDGSDCEH